jgi:hypothetical protein
MSPEGIISATSYTDIPQPVLFYVSSNSSSETDNKITALIERKMIEKGYHKASVLEAANVGVTYKCTIDQYSGPAYSVWHFQVAVRDLRSPDNIEIFWKGQTHSAGESRNIELIAPYFIDVLFKNYGKTVSKGNFKIL